MDGVRARKQIGDRSKHQGGKWLFLNYWGKTFKATKPQGAKRKLTQIFFFFVKDI
ncbi:hypothetical protein Hanom_Chr04g00382831 [Helianthus anomalus]